MKTRISIFLLILGVGILGASILVFAQSKSAAFANLAANKECGQAAPDDFGFHYSAVKISAPPKISETQAIEIATKNISVPLNSASPQVVAKYTLFTDDNRGTEKPDNEEVALAFQNVPAWVITFCGQVIPPFSGKHETKRADITPIPPSTEWNVVINAETGEYMEEFSFR